MPRGSGLSPQAERAVAAGIDRQTRGNESERRRLYQSARIPYPSVAASTRPARTFDAPNRPVSTLTQTNRVVKTKPKVESVKTPEIKRDTTYTYYSRTSNEKPLQEKNLIKTSNKPLTKEEFYGLNKGGTIKNQTTMKKKPAPKKKMSAKEMEAMKKANNTPMMKYGGKMGKKSC